ncbi:MAG: Rrf2 family transcriptional regulator [Candidatus Obscuribacterales bacterium]|nr:Rrf2 family transcriptional regulator [Candidatus Obscuribacterales bacterium]
MFSQTAEYALRAMVFMSMNYEQAFTTHQISEATKVPAPYLSKVLQALAKAELVHSQRGIGGGFALSRGPEEISILQVINAVDPICRITSCPLKLEAHGKHLCALHKKIDDATANIEKTFAKTSMSDLLVSVPLCDVSGLSHSLLKTI